MLWHNGCGTEYNSSTQLASNTLHKDREGNTKRDRLP